MAESTKQISFNIHGKWNYSFLQYGNMNIPMMYKLTIIAPMEKHSP